MRRAVAAAITALALAGCGGGEPWVEYESVSPPVGIEAAGTRTNQGRGNDPDSGKEAFKLRPREGESIRYAVAVRNVTDREISVTGVAADEDRDGAFVPESVADAPVVIPPGQRGQVTVEGRIHGCQYGGQQVPLAGPELEMRDADGEKRTQELALDIRVDIVVEGC